MAKRKSTIRKMTGLPLSREFYHVQAELEAIARRLEKLGDRIQEAELAQQALLVKKAGRGAR